MYLYTSCPIVPSGVSADLLVAPEGRRCWAAPEEPSPALTPCVWRTYQSPSPEMHTDTWQADSLLTESHIKKNMLFSYFFNWHNNLLWFERYWEWEMGLCTAGPPSWGWCVEAPYARAEYSWTGLQIKGCSCLSQCESATPAALSTGQVPSLRPKRVTAVSK